MLHTTPLMSRWKASRLLCYPSGQTVLWQNSHHYDHPSLRLPYSLMLTLCVVVYGQLLPLVVSGTNRSMASGLGSTSLNKPGWLCASNSTCFFSTPLSPAFELLNMRCQSFSVCCRKILNCLASGAHHWCAVHCNTEVCAEFCLANFHRLASVADHTRMLRQVAAMASLPTAAESNMTGVTGLLYWCDTH